MRITAVSTPSTHGPGQPIEPRPEDGALFDVDLPPTGLPTARYPEALPTTDVSLATVDLDGLREELGPAWASTLDHFVAELGSLDLLGSDVMAQVFNALRQGDAEGALELFSALVKVIDPKASAGGQVRDRDDVESQVELGAVERDAALEQLAEARAAYQRAMAQLSAMEAEMTALRASLEEDLTGAQDGLSIDVPLDEIANVAGERQSFLDRRRELSRLPEVLYADRAMIEHAEALAERFASDPENPGYLTREQASQLAAALLAAPGADDSGVHVQVSPALVKAAIRGFERATGDANARELLAAQLARTAYASADARPADETKRGYGREALEEHLRTPGSVYFDFSAHGDAAAVHAVDATARSVRSGATIVRDSSKSTDYQPGDRLEATFTIHPPDLPFELKAKARWSSYPPEEYENRETPNTRWVYRFSEGPNGEVQVERSSQTQPRFGRSWSPLSEPESLPSLTRDADGSFQLVLDAQPLEEIDRLSQCYILSLGGSSASFVNRT
ncbi:MAG: hypothetical protein AAF654_13065 [Myxococcota bacterium]